MSSPDATLEQILRTARAWLPFVLAALVFIHIVALHKVGSNNPDGIEIKKGPKGNKWSDTAPADGIPFHPYYSVKDIAGVAGFLFLFAAVIFFAPEMGGYFLEAPPTIDTGQPAEDPCPHRAGLVLHAVLRNPACSTFDCRFCLPGCCCHVRFDPGDVLPALARPQPG